MTFSGPGESLQPPVGADGDSAGNCPALVESLAQAVGCRPALSSTAWAAAGRVGDRCIWQVGGVEAAGLPADSRTWFDLASLTKVLVTVPLVEQYVNRGLLDPDEPLGSLLPDAGWRWMSPRSDLESVTTTMLLAHASGLPATAPVFTWGIGWPQAVGRILHMGITGLPQSDTSGVWRNCRYSDLGYLLVGAVLEVVTGQSFPDLAASYLAESGLDSGLAFGPLTDRPVASMGFCTVRRRDLLGEVHDLTCSALGGVTPHAGLFGTLPGVCAAAERLLASPLSYTNLARVRAVDDAGQARGLGWEVRTPGWSAGSWAKLPQIGHIGSTGVGVWLHEDGYSVVLSNRTGVFGDAYAAEVAGFRRSIVNRLEALLLEV